MERQVGHGFDHIAQGFKGNQSQLLKAELKATFGSLHQVFEALHIIRAERGNLVEHGLVIIAVVKVRAVVKADAVERRHQAQVHMVLHALTAQGKQLFDQVRQGDDGGASVKGKAVLLVHIGAATGGV